MTTYLCVVIILAQYLLRSCKEFNSSSLWILCQISQVDYDVTGFLEKNRDTLPPGAMDILKQSDNSLVSTIFSGRYRHASNSSNNVGREGG